MKSAWPWLSDELLASPEFERRRMFGCEAYYRAGKLALVLTGEDVEPWNGVCACTSRELHPALRKDFPALVSHPVLGKWLYVSCADPAFEETASGLVRLALAGDPRLGVEPKPKRRKNAPVRPVVKKQKIR